MNQLIYYLHFPFVRNALVVGVLISMCASLLGVILVLKKYSFIGDGLSHVAFGALAVSTALKISSRTILTLPVTIICAVVLLRKNRKEINGDAAIAMLSVGALAFGYLLMNIFPSSGNLSGDVCTTLFGSTSILTLSKEEVLLSAILSVVVLLFFIFSYRQIFVITFDEDFARSLGVDVERYNLIIAIIIAIIIVLSMNLVGSLLISALIVFPPLSAMCIFKDFKSVMIFSTLISMFVSFTGIILSIIFGTPVGSTVVAADAVMYGLCYLISLKRK